MNKISTQPNSSGIDEFLVIVSGIPVSESIEYEYQIFAKSRLTLREIGMIEQRRRTNLKNISPQFPWKPFNTTIVPAKKSMRIKRIFERKFISSSTRPIFDLG